MLNPTKQKDLASVGALFLALAGMFIVLGFVPKMLFRSLSFAPPALLQMSHWSHVQTSPQRFTLTQTVTIPERCATDDCAFLLKEVGAAATITLGDETLASSGVFPRVILRENEFPVVAPVPRAMVSSSPQVLAIDVFCKRDCDAMVANFEAQIVRRDEAVSYVRAKTMGFAFLPVATSMGLVCIAFITGVFLITGRHQFWFGVMLVMHCVANGMAYFLFADVSYETLPMRYAAPVHLILRRIGDIAFFALSLAGLRFTGIARSVGYAGFAVSCGATLAFTAAVLYALGGSVDTLELLQTVDVLQSYASPLKFAALLTCLVGSLLSLRRGGYALPTAVFTFLVSITAFDEVVMFGYPYRSYVGKFHALVVGCVFLAIFLRRRVELSTKIVMEAKADADLTHLARQVAHDIRSPLAALKMACAAADDMQEDVRNIIETSVGRLTGIADTLLASRSKADAQPGTGTETIIALGPITRALLAQKRIEFSAHAGLRLQLTENADAHRACVAACGVEFQRALSNLVNNAAEAMDHAGDVTVHLQAADDSVSVMVADAGRGIPASIVRHLGQVGVTDKDGGNGLGVAHAKRFAESRGGALLIESKLDVGTRVTIQLPRCPVPAQGALH